jgi:hypothetical protein
MVLQPTVLIMARPGNEFAFDAYLKPFSQVMALYLAAEVSIGNGIGGPALI